MKTISVKHFIATLTVATSVTMIGCAEFPNSLSYSGGAPQNYSPEIVSQYSSTIIVQDLYDAGFVVMPADAFESGFSETLSHNHITSIQRNGKTYYVYPDPVSHQILMGEKSALKSYQSLINEKLPNIASTAPQVGKNVAAKELTSSERHALAREGEHLKKCWRSLDSKKDHDSIEKDTGSMSLSSSSGLMKKELSSSRELEKKAHHELKKIGF